MDALNRLVDAVDKWPIRRLLIVNSVLGGFAALANGGAMVLTISGKAPALSADLPYMAAMIAAAVTVLLLGLGARVFPPMLGTALRVHGVLLLAFGCLILLEGIKVADQGPPEGIKFTWNAVMVVALVTYSVYFARRSLLTPVQLTRPVFRFSHLGAAIAALVVSALVFGRLSTYGP
jgi:hypothetical protein